MEKLADRVGVRDNSEKVFYENMGRNNTCKDNAWELPETIKRHHPQIHKPCEHKENHTYHFTIKLLKTTDEETWKQLETDYPQKSSS